jgi:hypothetical protein
MNPKPKSCPWQCGNAAVLPVEAYRTPHRLAALRIKLAEPATAPVDGAVAPDQSRLGATDLLLPNMHILPPVGNPETTAEPPSISQTEMLRPFQTALILTLTPSIIIQINWERQSPPNGGPDVRLPCRCALWRFYARAAEW